MSLCRLIYMSQVNPRIQLDLDGLLRVSRDNNERVDLTGFLFFDGSYFAQALEGSRKDISDTYHRIVKDSRHGHLVLISCGEIRSRIFGQWSMGLHEGMDEESREHLLKVFSLSAIDLNNVTVENMVYFLQTLAIKLHHQKVDRLSRNSVEELVRQSRKPPLRRHSL